MYVGPDLIGGGISDSVGIPDRPVARALGGHSSQTVAGVEPACHIYRADENENDEGKHECELDQSLAPPAHAASPAHAVNYSFGACSAPL